MLLTLALFALLVPQAMAPAPTLSVGSVAGNVYSNPDLGITYTFPAGWTATPEADRGVLDVRFTPQKPDDNEIEMFALDSSVFPEVTPLRISRKTDAGVRYALEPELAYPRLGPLKFLQTNWICESGRKRLYQSRLAADAKGWRMVLFVTAPSRKLVDEQIAGLASLRFEPVRRIEGQPGPVIQSIEGKDAGRERLVKKVQPRYPDLALQARRQGTVLLEATIGTDGKIRSLNPIAGDPVLIPGAVDAVRQWEYKPYVVDGKPLEVYTLVTVTFSMGN